MSRTQTKIKVSTEELLKAVRARRAKEIRAHEKAVTAYEKAKDGHAVRVVTALRKAADDAEGGKLPETGWRNITIPFKRESPDKPSTLNLDRIDRLIKTLEMAADDAVTISADDAAEYLG